MKKLIVNNWVYILWACIYIFVCSVLLGGTVKSFAIVICIYAISIAIALSPIGELILRFVENAKPLRTREDKEYLEPLFEEVYQNAKEIYPNLTKNIQLFIINKKFVNAFAFGRHSIAVTRPAMEVFSENELKGIIAHEFGHIANGDTKALLLNLVGNGIFSILMIILNVILLIINFVTACTRNVIAMIMCLIVNFMITAYLLIFIHSGELILSINSRSNEYRADKFSHDCEQGEGLISALYLLQKVSLPANITIIERLKASHPDLPNRIAKLEALEEA